jgi:hypothetical protein
MWAETSLRWIDRALPDPDRPKEQFSEIATDGRRAGAVMEGQSYDGSLLVYPNSPHGAVFRMILHVDKAGSPACA